jgi:hypothetical protein
VAAGDNRKERTFSFKSAAMTITGKILKSDSMYNATGKIARWSLRNLPRSFIYNSLNVWGRERELPKPPGSRSKSGIKQTGRENKMGKEQLLEKIRRGKPDITTHPGSFKMEMPDIMAQLFEAFRKEAGLGGAEVTESGGKKNIEQFFLEKFRRQLISE